MRNKKCQPHLALHIVTGLVIFDPHSRFSFCAVQVTDESTKRVTSEAL